MSFVLNVGMELREMPIYLPICLSSYLYIFCSISGLLSFFFFFCQGEVPFSIQSISCYGISSSEWGTIGKKNINIQIMKGMEKLNSSIYGITGSHLYQPKEVANKGNSWTGTGSHLPFAMFGKNCVCLAKSKVRLSLDSYHFLFSSVYWLMFKGGQTSDKRIMKRSLCW